MPDAGNDVLLRMHGIEKRFGPVHALRGVDLDVRAGEVHALVGENGAGKSTLMKVLSGAHRPDAGTMTLDGAPYTPAGPLDARRRGVAMIYQELSLAPHLFQKMADVDDADAAGAQTLDHREEPLGFAA